jgi:hypothetical protein
MFILKSNWIAIFVLSAFLSGCADYMNHRDTVTLGAGSAMQANIAVHTVNPFPPQANNTRIDRDGNSVVNAQERYLTPGDPDVVTVGSDSFSAGEVGTSE